MNMRDKLDGSFCPQGEDDDAAGRLNLTDGGVEFNCGLAISGELLEELTLGQLDVYLNANNNPAQITATGCATGVYADCGGWLWITLTTPGTIIGQADIEIEAIGLPPAVGFCDLVTDQGRHTISVTFN